MCTLPMSSNVECVLLSTMANSVFRLLKSEGGLHVGLGGVGEGSNCIIKLFILIIAIAINHAPLPKVCM